ILAGRTLTITNSASDAETPQASLTYSLIGPPQPASGASINPTNGIFVWRPAIAQVGSNQFNIQVADNGSPSQSATQSFWIRVDRPISPTFTSAIMNAGQLSLTIS